MHLLLYISLCGMAVSWTALFMTPCVSAQTTLHYNEARLNRYLFLSQQLRYEMRKELQALVNRIVALQSAVYNANTEVANRIVDGTTLMTNELSRLTDAGSYMEMSYAAASKAIGKFSYTDVNQKIFFKVKLDHFMGYDGPRSEAKVSISGIYEVEYRTQLSGGLASTVLDVYGPDGTKLHSVTTKFLYNYGCTPATEMFELQAGSLIVMSGLKSFYSSTTYIYAYWFMSGRPMASQLVIRYMGPLA